MRCRKARVCEVVTEPSLHMQAQPQIYACRRLPMIAVGNTYLRRRFSWLAGPVFWCGFGELCFGRLGGFGLGRDRVLRLGVLVEVRCGDNP